MLSRRASYYKIIWSNSMDGFKRPVRKPSPTTPQPVPTQPTLAQLPRPVVSASRPPSSVGAPVRQKASPAPSRKSLKWLWLVAASLIVATVGASYAWYHEQLKPVDASDDRSVSVVIEQGSSSVQIARTLKSAHLIRDEFAFTLYIKLTRSELKAGSCRFAPRQSVQEIVDTLQKGCNDFKVITFYPGETLSASTFRPSGRDITSQLAKFGFSREQIKTAIETPRSGPLFAGKPAGSSLEGYVFGETYYVPTDASPETVLSTAFDELYSQLQSNKLIDKYTARGLTLYQAITLASIVQRELGCSNKTTEASLKTCQENQRRIAQVFYSRLELGMTLGSDVTFIYGADKLGIPPSVDVDSPYNTRIHAGLPPGPIASPGLGALKAVADPARGDDLFFLAGDDGVIYFAKTQSEHEANIQTHCQKLCSTL